MVITYNITLIKNNNRNRKNKNVERKRKKEEDMMEMVEKKAI